MKKHIWAICFTSALTAFTVFIALDTFVLSAAYNENATGMNLSVIYPVSGLLLLTAGLITGIVGLKRKQNNPDPSIELQSSRVKW